MAACEILHDSGFERMLGAGPLPASVRSMAQIAHRIEVVCFQNFVAFIVAAMLLLPMPKVMHAAGQICKPGQPRAGVGNCVGPFAVVGKAFHGGHGLYRGGVGCATPRVEHHFVGATDDAGVVEAILLQIVTPCRPGESGMALTGGEGFPAMLMHATRPRSMRVRGLSRVLS